MPEISIIHRQTDITAFGKGIVNKIATDEVIQNLKNWLSLYISISQEYTKQIIIIGTSGARTATNVHLISDWLKHNFHLKLHIISGEREAYLNAIANIDDFSYKNMLLFDVGGGSTEFSLIKDKNIVELLSVNIGIRSLMAKFGKDIENQREYVKKILHSVSFIINDFELIGIGGTVTSLAALNLSLTDYDSGKVHQSEISKNDLETLYNSIKKKEILLPKSIPGLDKRTDIMIYGTMIVMEIITYFQKEKIIVSDKGLQFGVLNLPYSELEELLKHD